MRGFGGCRRFAVHHPGRRQQRAGATADGGGVEDLEGDETYVLEARVIYPDAIYDVSDMATVAMPTKDDNVYEGDERYAAALSAAPAAVYTVNASSAEATGEILDNEALVLSLSGGGDVNEGEAIALLGATRARSVRMA
ncbi:MAG: hypothetical protein ACYYK0_05670 [Candidatus Eutrophobiaceae bacterium]